MAESRRQMNSPTIWTRAMMRRDPVTWDLTPADLADIRCPDCGHPRTGCGCSCTGPGTCGGGTDDVELCGDSLIFYCTLPRGHEDSHYSDDLPKWRWE